MILRVVLSVLLFAHGAIHLIGVPKYLRLERKLFASLWLVAFVVMASAAVLVVARYTGWWKVALAGVVLSQVLIGFSWADAKLGTVANVLLLVPVGLAAAHARFEGRIEREVAELLRRQADHQLRDERSSIVQREELDRLPAPIRRWLETSDVVGRERARTVRIQQRGEMRTSPEEPWMEIEAEQIFTVDVPAFVWTIDTTMMRVVPITGRDRYADGQGEMLIKAASLVNVVDAKDEKTTTGSMQRYLGEMVWFPSAALSPYIVWEPIDDRRARATMHDAGRTVNAEFAIDAEGRVASVHALRFYGSGPDAKRTPWHVPAVAWRSVRGVVVPVRGKVVWQLPEGDFEWYRWEILDIETNRAEPPTAIAPMALAELTQ